MNQRTALLILLAGSLLTAVGCKTAVIEPGTDRSAKFCRTKSSSFLCHINNLSRSRILTLAVQPVNKPPSRGDV